jgi:hypothetical protein
VFTGAALPISAYKTAGSALTTGAGCCFGLHEKKAAATSKRKEIEISFFIFIKFYVEFKL